MKKFIYPIVAIATFLAMQAVAGIAAVGVLYLLRGEQMNECLGSGEAVGSMEGLTSPGLLAFATVMSGVLTVGVISLLRMIDWSKVFRVKDIEWKWGMTSIAAAIFGIFGINVMDEMLDLPNLMEDTFLDLSESWAGVLCLGVIGPVLEELIFREGVEGYMLRNGVRPWVAIVSSALMFGIVHLNPAQVPFAFAVGIILGFIYCRTGNIVITSILHIANNSAAVWQMQTLGEKAKDFSMVAELGGTLPAVFIACSCLAVCIVWIVSSSRLLQERGKSMWGKKQTGQP